MTPVKRVCPTCVQTNRMPADRLAAHPRCGRCGGGLTPDKPAKPDAAADDKAAPAPTRCRCRRIAGRPGAAPAG
jgi:thioredoxin 2